MKKKYLWIIAILLVSSMLFGEETLPVTDFSVNKTEILLGGKINFQFSIEAVNNENSYEILNEEFRISHPFEIISIDYKKLSNQTTLVSGEMTSFIPGEQKDIKMSVPVSFSDGTVAIFSTDNQTFNVLPVLTKEEEEALKKVEDPSTIELRASLPQEKFRLYFEGWLLLALIVIVLSILAVIIYRYVIKRLRSKMLSEEKSCDPLDKLSPYEKFLFMMETNSAYSADRKETEIRLSGISCALKELITQTFNFDAQLNAKSETTRELLRSMRNTNIDDVLVSNIAAVFNSMDMVKFAKANINQDVFNDYVQNIRQFGSKINEIGKQELNNENI
jgi:hypothetical protein